MPLDLIKLRRRIERTGKTQREIAAVAGIAQPNLSRVLARGTNDLDLIERIAFALRCNVMALLSREIRRPARGIIAETDHARRSDT